MPAETGRRHSLAERVAQRLGGRPAQPSPPSLPQVVSAPMVSSSSPLPEPEAPRHPPVEINLQRLQAAGFITPHSPANALTEQFRVIKRQLLAGAFPKGAARPVDDAHVVMVVSGAPGEGKTFTALNLALSISSERDLHVLLVDGDSQRRAMARLLGLGGDEKGLVDLLTNKDLSPRDVMLRTTIPNLAFLPAGRPHPHAAELLASKQMAQLMRDLAARYPDRVIIIDTAALLAASEASVLAPHVGQTVVVVEKDRTSRRALERTLDLLEGCPNVSCILNMAPDEIGISGCEYYDNGQA